MPVKLDERDGFSVRRHGGRDGARPMRQARDVVIGNIEAVQVAALIINLVWLDL